MLSSYEKTIGSIRDVTWERRVRLGSYPVHQTGNLLISTMDGEIEAIIRTGYISFNRNKEDKRDEYCEAIRLILLRNLHPKKETEMIQIATRKDPILSIPLPIMLAEDDKIFIFRYIAGEPRGICFRVTDAKK